MGVGKAEQEAFLVRAVYPIVLETIEAWFTEFGKDDDRVRCCA